MISLLIISHSADVARGVKQLAEQMAKGNVAIAAAGGTPDGGLGTSVEVINEAIATLGTENEILVLVDMGSAVMSAEMALEMSSVRYRLSKAPLVEGAVVAATEATREDATLDEVAAVAERALEAKDVGDSVTDDATSPPAEEPAAATASSSEAQIKINNKAGLHMRPANLFIQTANRFKSSLRARNLDRPDRPEANIKSLLDVMKLGVSPGHTIALAAEGDDADEAIAALQTLVDNNFGEA